MNTVLWAPRTRKQLLKIKDVAMRKRIYEEAQCLALFPACHGVRKLVNHEYGYRLRVGDYRVLFDYDGTVKIVSIEEVKKRDEHTY
ncbi:MAG: type II toxin-antitoxin system RelE/ParE family toxin [Desulfomicrobium sp.]|nr:type II toxin-antitoxin system RelE/ParE family toxin [Desulfomicrobium sp.]NLV98132.1 type II toxin-antitoxin system RelE/ParE family toxin [Desulfovibrionales bacterium]